jgi:oligoendopeptidase F
MSAVASTSYPAVRWDLSDLFSGIDDPKILEVIDACAQRAKEFASRYRGTIDSNDLNAETLQAAIVEYEAISNELNKPLTFAHLVFATNTGDPKVGACFQMLQERVSDIQVDLLFFDLELQAAPSGAVEMALASELLANYGHFVRKARTYSPYRLSEKEEIVFERTANTGCRAWQRLHDEITSNQEFGYSDGSGEPEVLTLQETLDRLRDPDRSVRQAAANALSYGLQALERPICFTYNTLLLDKKIEDEMRGLPSPDASRHLANELEERTVELVVSLCEEHYPLVARFYRLKGEILGFAPLTHVDRYAPLFETSEEVEWSEAKGIVLDAFGRFSREMRESATSFFDNRRIDAEPRAGKTGGAFCAGITPDTHPAVLLSYMNKLDDVMTLAHELGHGVHDKFSQRQTLLNYHPTLPMAELASTFAEMLVFESLVERADLENRVALYASKIEGIFATVFRQASMFRFEQACHRARRAQGELSPDEFGDIWQESIQKMFGDSVELGDQHRCWWSYVSHFISVPFYVYAYSFGELLVLSLYERAKNEGPGFSQKYVEMLSLGGSVTPAEQMATMGVDLESRDFWLGGFAALDRLVTEFERLWAEFKPIRAAKLKE